jgi:hypothetical protein
MTLEPEYDLNQIAEAMRRSPRWVRNQIKAGKDGNGPFIEHQGGGPGSKITMTAEQVEKFRASRTQTAPVVVESITTGRKKRSA